MYPNRQDLEEGQCSYCSNGVAKYHNTCLHKQPVAVMSQCKCIVIDCVIHSIRTYTLKLNSDEELFKNSNGEKAPSETDHEGSHFTILKFITNYFLLV